MFESHNEFRNLLHKIIYMGSVHTQSREASGTDSHAVAQLIEEALDYVRL